MSSKTFPSTGGKPAFDPSAHFDAADQDPVPKGDKPAFNVNKQFEIVHDLADNNQFKGATDWLNIQQGYQPMDKNNAIAIGDHTIKTGQASQRINDHLMDIDQSVHNLIYNKKKDLQGRSTSEELGLNPKEIGPLNFQAQQLDNKNKQDVYVSPIEVQSFKEGMSQNQVMMRQGLAQKANDLSKTDPTQAASLKADVYRLDRQDDPAKDKKISSNIEKIYNGDYDYDIVTGSLVKPVGFFGGIVEGFKQKGKAFDEYSIYSTSSEPEVLKYLNKKIKSDPDEPTVVGTGGFANVLPGGEAGMMMGGQPLKPLAGGAVAGALGGPEAGAAAMGLISAPEMYKLGYANALPQNYAAIKKQHPEISDADAYHQASELAEKQANVDAATGMAMGLLGGEFAFKPTGLSTGLLQKSVVSALKQIGEAGVKKSLEGLGVGTVGATGQVIKNIMAQSAGLPVDATEGVVENLKTGVTMTLGMTLAAKAGKLLKPSTYNKLFQGLSKIPAEAVGKELDNLKQTGHITPEEVQKVQEAIDAHKKLDSQILDDVPEADRLKVQAKIKEREILKEKIDRVHEAYHPEINEQIKKLDEEIVNISKGTERGELQKLIDKEHKDGKIEGYVTEPLINASEKELNGYFKEISEQINAGNEDQAIATFGENIVNKAKELHPKKEEIQSKYKGYFEEPESDGTEQTGMVQDKKMREAATGFIGEVRREGSSSYNSAKEIGDKVGATIQWDKENSGTLTSVSDKSKKVLLARNYEYKGKPLSEAIKSEIKKASDNGAEFILGDMTDVDTQLIDYLKEIGAEFTIYKTKGNEPIKGFTDNEKYKLSENEIPVRGPEEVPFGETPANGEPVGEGVPIEGQPKEEGNPASREGLGSPREIGITHNQMNAIAEELGLPPYEGSPEKVAEWDQQAAKKLQEPEAMSNLFTKLRDGVPPDNVETRMMLQYMGDLMGKIDINPYDRELQNQVLRTKNLFNIAGRIQGKALVARKGSITAESTLSDFIMRDREANKAPLTDEQISISKKEYEDIKAANEAFEAKIEQQKQNSAKAKAEQKIKEEAKTAKKQTKKNYGEERNQIFSDIKEKLRKARGETSIVAVPYAKELIAIAPDVMKLVKNYVEQGISELPELVKRVQETLKGEMPHITENDVHNIIAGEYNGKKPTRSQLAQQIFDLRREAALINELEQLENGQIPKSKNKQRQHNQKIEALRGKIKELKDEMGLNEKTDADKLASLKSRYKKQISDLEKKISSGDYGPDVKPEPIVLDKEAIDLQDEMIKLKLDREARLAKEEYEGRNKIQKGKDLVADALDATRTIQTNPDLSFFGRQGIKYLVTHPVKGPKLFWESVRQAGSQKRYDRWLYDMHNSAAWKLIEDSELAVLDPNTLHASKREEQWRSQLIHKIPVAGQVAKASERAFTSAANMARVDWFMEGVDILRKQGKTLENSPEEYKGWASAVNNMTGRGGLGALEPVVGQLAIPFWSPRLIASNVNLFLNPAYYVKIPKTARIMLIKNMAQYMVTGIGFLGLANVLGAETETDPRSSDFGKIKVGNTRYDIWGGASQYIRVVSQLWTESRKANGNISELKPRQMVTTGTNLARTKLSPLFGFAIDAKLGENVVGEKVAWKDAYKLLIPMLWNDIQDAKNDSGSDGAAVAGLLSFLGIGAQTYGGKSGNATSHITTTRKSSQGKPTKQSKPHKTQR